MQELLMIIQVPRNIVAVKQLFSTSENAFAKESEILKSLSSENHRHDNLITLLATYKQCGVYYLVFPLAEADLEGFWGLYPVPPTKDTARAKWLVDQCQGLAEALSKIHRYDTRSDTTMPNQTTRQQMSPRTSHSASGILRLIGRHGDIKPKNILWFPNSTLHGRYGVLKITDFGIANFRVDDTGLTPEPPNSRTYRSPEWDLEPRRLSTLCDIWALGCVYLVFITWYFGGLEDTKTFTEMRRADGNCGNRFDNDHFFHTETDERGVAKAKLKNTVIQVSTFPGRKERKRRLTLFKPENKRTSLTC
jgi:serine/threonine protein kinase